MVLFLPCERAGHQASLDSEAAVEPHLSTVTLELYPHQQQLLLVSRKTRWLMWATNHSTHTASAAMLLRTGRGSKPEHRPARPRKFTALRNLLAETGWRKGGGTST